VTDEDDKNITLMGIRKQVKGQKLTEDEQLAIENHARFMIQLRRLIQHVMDYWGRWLILMIGGTLTAEYSGLINIIGGK